MDATPEASATPRDTLVLATYEVERQDNAAAVQLMLALIAGGIAYIVPVLGLITAHCQSAANHLFSGTGCQHVSHWLIALAPIPAVALYGFLVANQITIEARSFYLEDLEAELSKRSSSARLRVPDGQTSIVGKAYHSRMPALTATLAQVGAFVVVVVMIVACAGLLPWLWPGALLLALYLVALIPILITIATMVLPLNQRRMSLHERPPPEPVSDGGSGPVPS